MSEEDSGEAVDECIALLNEISSIKSGQSSVELVLLDPMGRSQILHEDAVSRELSGEEMNILSTGPSVPVFDADAMS
jgi:C4-type Zn-finger protein